MLEVFAEWFGQGLSTPVIAVDAVFFLAGVWVMLLHIKNAKMMLALLAFLMILSMILQFTSFLLNILAVLLCGLSTMMLAGAVCAWCVYQMIFHIRKKRERKIIKR